MTVPLHAHSYFSLLRGVGSPDSLAARAAELGYPALALTDRDALYGAASFQLACRELGLKPLFGAELTLDDGSQITLLAMNQTGYGNLCRLVSYARLGRPKGEAWLPSEKLSEQSTGLICLSGPSLSSTIPHLIRANRKREAVRLAAHYRDLFGDRFYLEAQHHALPGDDRLIADLAALGSRLGIPLVATADVHYPRPEDRPLQDIVTCIRTKTTLATPSTERLPNGQFFLQSPDVFAEPFRRYPEALEQTAAIAARCDVELDFHDARFPSTPLPAGHTADDELRRLSREGAARRYGNPSSRVCRQLDHELGVIAMRGLAPFFLIAADIAERFRGRCRGSAAGSLVSYCLGMSAVDPLAYNMLFERFINPERDSPPDIDIDFSQDDREEAIAYCYRTYGYERAGMVANYVRFRGRSAVRDVGKVLGMPADLIDRIARTLDHFASGDQLTIAIEDLTAQEPGANQPWPLLARFCRELDDTPRHLSVHVGGMLLTGRPLIELLGLEQARKEGVVVVGADKEDVEDLGLGKLDLLCLRALSVVQESEELERGRGVPLDVASLNLDDPAVYEALGQADTIGASQVESRAQQQSLVRTRPRNFTDLMAQVAIIRPGPIQGGAVHPYYRRRAGLEPVTYLHPALAPILEPTLGIFLYQEQVLLGVSALTGCSAGEADGFRRAMGSHRSHEAMTRLRPWFI
ncbi:MAG: DNA polymerase III subunit alpha, partial [Chloroflexota bacterium]